MNPVHDREPAAFVSAALAAVDNQIHLKELGNPRTDCELLLPETLRALVGRELKAALK
jgi:hypothetical protein